MKKRNKQIDLRWVLSVTAPQTLATWVTANFLYDFVWAFSGVLNRARTTRLEPCMRQR